MSLYTDRGAHYFHTPKAGARSIGPIRPRSAGRSRNWASSIGAFSPQARADRSGPSQTLAGPLAEGAQARRNSTVEAANAFIREVYLPAHNARFANLPSGEGSAFIPVPGVDLDEILCVAGGAPGRK